MDGEEKWLNHYLDEWGQLVFQSTTNLNLFAHRNYYWIDRVVIIDEEIGRRFISQMTFSKFQEELDENNWSLVTKEEAAYVKHKWNEIIAIRRDIKINQILE